MEKTLKNPALIALIGFIAGGVILGTIGVSAHGGFGGEHMGQRIEVIAKVLGVEVDELKDLRGSGTTIEEFALENGFDSTDDFHASVQATMVEQWQKEGLSEDQIAERLDKIEEMQARREAQRDIVSKLLGIDIETLEVSKAEGKDSMQALVEAAGYEDISEFREVVRDAMEELGYDEPGLARRGLGSGSHRRAF